MEAQGSTSRRLTWLGGRNAGKRRALELHIAFHARSPEEAQKAVEDLHDHGVALLDAAGNRVRPSSGNGARFSYHRFDEGPCPDCDGAGCEHCGDGRRGS